MAPLVGPFTWEMLPGADGDVVLVIGRRDDGEVAVAAFRAMQGDPPRIGVQRLIFRGRIPDAGGSLRLDAEFSHPTGGAEAGAQYVARLARAKCAGRLASTMAGRA